MAPPHSCSSVQVTLTVSAHVNWIDSERKSKLQAILFSTFKYIRGWYIFGH